MSLLNLLTVLAKLRKAVGNSPFFEDMIRARNFLVKKCVLGILVEGHFQKTDNKAEQQSDLCKNRPQKFFEKNHCV
jgi:hypothetical protein